MKKQVVLITPGYFSIGLLSIGSLLESRGYDVQIMAETLSYWMPSSGISSSFIERLSAVLDEKRCVAVGVTAMTPNAVSVIKLSRAIKKRYPGIPLLIGGNHVTVMPERMLAESAFDIGIVGEGEFTALETIRKLEDKIFPTCVAGTFEKLHDGKIVSNGRRPLISDLSVLPPLNYELFNYRPVRLIRDRSIKARRAVFLMISRGCPYSCAFCSSELIWERRLRFFPMEHIMGHIESIVGKYRLDSLCFLDDELITNSKFITAFCKELIGRKLNKRIVWECQARVNAVREDTLELLKEAGCRLIRFGMESGSDRILRFLKRGTITVRDCYDAARLCDKHKMNCFGSFMIGSPDETLDDIMGTINLIEKSGINAAACYTLVPYPGTEVYHRCVDENLLKDNINWNDFVVEKYSTKNTTQFTMRNHSFSSDQLFDITRYIEQNVIKPLNLGLKENKTNHRKNLERVINGESRLAEPTFKVRLYEKKDIIEDLVGRICAEPQPVRFVFKKAFAKLRRKQEALNDL